jgi:hypothetical protein
VISMEENKTVEVVVNSFTLPQLKELLLAGVSAKDEREGAINVTVDVSKVIPGTEGIYQAEYAASDSLGNTSRVSRKVAVISSAKKDFLINGKKVPANDVYVTEPTVLNIQLPEGYRLYVAQGYKTRAQMKYYNATQGTSIEVSEKGYYTLLAQNDEYDTIIVYVYIY